MFTLSATQSLSKHSLSSLCARIMLGTLPLGATIQEEADGCGKRQLSHSLEGH